ncbi:hypothetical protein AB1Y20_020823 [Prymnesium parvum]|uniref:DUF2834 domain-containing protein n=1 Tax=Prymnesium parvum TaxID=97485 RepID=A0AB34K0J0_PRYPA
MRLLSAYDPLLQPASKFFSSLDTPGTLLVAALLALAAVAMALPPYFGYRYRGNFWTALFGSSDAMTSVSIDIFIVAAAFLLWAAHDVRTLRLSAATFAGLCAGLAIALAMPVPLYLAARTVRQAQMGKQARDDEEEVPLHRICWLCPLSIFVVAGVVSQVIFITNVENLQRGH